MKKIIAILIAGFIAPAGAVQYGRDVQQAMALEAAAAQYAPAQADIYNGALPVRVLDAGLERDIRAGNHTTSVADLERCKMIWPNGVFVWGAPNAGDGITNLKPTCLAEVYLKAAPNGQQAGINGGVNDKIVAVAYVPAGGALKCNIGNFPQAGYLPAAGDVIFPADDAPSVADVEKVMDKENKQNAVMKTASAALIGGFGMFLAADKNEKGKTAALTAAGAVGAGGLAFGSTQVGKVAGDTMMSAGTNAAIGAVMGNMSAGSLGGGDAILVIKDCEKEKCLWGYVRKGTVYKPGGKDPDKELGEVWYNTGDKQTFLKKIEGGCGADKDSDCYERITGVFNAKVADKHVDEYTDPQWVQYFNSNSTNGKIGGGCFVRDSDGNDKYIISLTDNSACAQSGYWAKLSEMSDGGTTMLAMVVLGSDQKEGFFGTKMKDFRKNKSENKYADPIGRNADGTVNGNEKLTGNEDVYKIANFIPLTTTADDGEVVDFNNKARMGSTLMGAGSGAAVGALASFQNAKAEVQERYLVELENYEGTLRNFYCITGTRYLDHYNASVVIPAMK